MKMFGIEPVIGVALSIPFISCFFLLPLKTIYSFLFLSGYSFAAFVVTLRLIPIFKEFNLKADLFGMDINKFRRGEDI